MTENNMNAQKNKVCYVCGGSGSVDCMVTCCLCKETTEHVFCMQKIHPVPKVWYCDGCKESYFEDGNVEEFELPSRQRKRPRDFGAGCSQSEYIEVLDGVANYNDEMRLENEVSGKEAYPVLQRNETREGSSNNQNRYINNEMENEVLDITQPLMLLNPDPNRLNYTISAIGWEGTFHVSASTFRSSFGVQAYFSSAISSKAVDIAKAMDDNLKFEFLPRVVVWPKIFQVDPTICEEDIALYLVPSEDERSKEKYTHLMEKMNLSNFAMRSHVGGNVELLVYSSKLLSTNSERSSSSSSSGSFPIKMGPVMYLWGVFRKTKKRCKLQDADKVTPDPDVVPSFSRRWAAEHQRNNSSSGKN